MKMMKTREWGDSHHWQGYGEMGTLLPSGNGYWSCYPEKPPGNS